MQLLRVKLAGFKSFVDPTVIDTPSRLVAIVGPNGCGKSNVIDAISWLLGENSPKYLRGESSTDLIFNGSNGRQPVGQASVEAIFDNSDGTIGGEYAQYAEISIKRVINRDADSAYYLNGVRCRKRDALDILMHTGLGPRSYAFVGQNMIGQVVNAKPQELRNHLESAAGIAKYKDRRHETELRIARTNENLSRVNDLRTELEGRLEQLKHQAGQAEKYKVLKVEERTLRGDLYAMQWRLLDGKMVAHTVLIQQAETAIEGHRLDLQRILAEMESKQEEDSVQQEKVSEVQGRFYALGNQITRAEQDILHLEERKRQLEAELGQKARDVAAVLAETAETDQDCLNLQTAIDELKPQLLAKETEKSALQAALRQAEETSQSWQSRWDIFNQTAAKANQVAQVEKNRIDFLEQKSASLTKRVNQLETDIARFDFTALTAEIEHLAQAVQAVEAELALKQEVLKSLRENGIALQNAQQEETKSLDKTRSELQQCRGQKASLDALQQTALGQKDSKVLPWLNKHQMTHYPRLAAQIAVEKGWEKATETVLGFALQAICVTDIQDFAAALSEFSSGQLCLFNQQALVEQSTLVSSAGTLPLLLSKVKSQFALEALLGGIYLAESLNEALNFAEQLAAHESIVTKDGVWLSKSWLKILRETDPKAGIFQREEELKTLSVRIKELEDRQKESEANLVKRREEMNALDKERDSAQQGYSQLQSKSGKVNAERKMKSERLAELKAQATRLQNEKSECESELNKAQTDILTARDVWDKALAEIESLSAERERLTKERDLARESLQHIREGLRKKTEETHQHALSLQSHEGKLQAALAQKGRLKAQVTLLEERQLNLQKEVAALPVLSEMKSVLARLLDEHAEVQNALNAAREVLSSIQHRVRELNEERYDVEGRMNTVRSSLETLRVEWQGYKVKADGVLEQLCELNVALESLLPTLPEEGSVEDYQRRLEQVVNRIQRLGAINLMAIEEYATCLERKEYLDKQMTDLQEALALLEEAIAKIDKETRIRFKETFDRVNARFQELFPTIFGGGKAYLELTSDDLLEAGVSMMACPPGKRNSTIYLLSGGEKSLTAIAFIFSIFHLNPAPFCLLDEVDAALDDANVVRFTNIVKAMADKTQFLFISHNKIAIEMGQQLIGVTMNEPGVSRLVSVDLEKAMSFVEKGIETEMENEVAVATS